MRLISTTKILAVFLGLSILTGCITIHNRRYKSGYHIFLHTKAGEKKLCGSSNAPINLKSAEKQGHNLSNHSGHVESTRIAHDAPKLQIDSLKLTSILRAHAKVKGSTTSVKLISKRNITQNTLQQKRSSKQEQTQADLLYVLALIAMVLLILLLLKNFPLLSLLLFIVALLLVLRYFDLI